MGGILCVALGGRGSMKTQACRGCLGETVKQERAQFHSGVSETYLNLDSKVVHCVPLDKSLNFSAL